MDLVAEVEDVGVIERHVVTVASEHDQVVLEDHASVAISSRWSLSLHVEDLVVIGATEHRRAIVHAHGPAHCLSLAHLLVVRVEVARVVVLDQERALHVVRSRRV